MIQRIVDEEDFDTIKWMLDEPVKNFTQAVVDDTIKANPDFQYKTGLRPRIIRKESGNCCDWCRAVVGTYEYPNVPKDVYKRHRYCRCTVEYDPGDGKRVNVHTKKWVEPDREGNINKRIEQLDKSNEDREKRWYKIGEKEIITLSPVYVSKSEKLFEYALKIRPIDDFEDVVCHADNKSFAFKDSKGNEIDLTAKEFAEIVKETHSYNGGNIRLISCEAGFGENSVAK